MLNRAPQYIYNFYSKDSTFIHGNVEVANENFTDPISGKDNIRQKIKDLNLHDCRAKIKQIDCLETLGNGFVIQVIGELSNNGRPMRRFLQTFVLAPAREEARTETGSYRRNVDGISASQNLNNEKFYVLNSIFRYEDEGLDIELENDVLSAQPVDNADKINSSTSIANSNSRKKLLIHPAEHPNGSPKESEHITDKKIDFVDKIAHLNEVNKNPEKSIETVVIFRKRNIDSEKREPVTSTQATPSNGLVDTSKNCEITDSINEVTKSEDDLANQVDSTLVLNSKELVTASNAQSNKVASHQTEPKTWANMVRSSQPVTSSQPCPPTVQVKNAPNERPQAPTSQTQQQQPSVVQRRRQSRKNWGSNSSRGAGGPKVRPPRQAPPV